MSDQSHPRADQRTTATPRDDGESYQISDRSASARDRVLVALSVLVMGCVKIPPTAMAVATPEAWVDAYAVGEGDGGVAAALKAVPTTSHPVVLHLRSGLYRGPFVFGSGTTVIGHGQAVLFLEGDGTVAASGGVVELKHLSVQGGAIGLAATGTLRLEDVSFSGQRSAALELRDAGVSGTGLVVTGRGGVGVDAVRSTVQLDQVRVEGGQAIAIAATDSTVTLRRLESQGPATAVQTIRGSLTLEDAKAASGRRAAVTTSDTLATLKNVDVTGHEYGVLARGGRLGVEGFVSRGAQIAGAAFLGSTVSLSNVTVRGAGSGGGVQLLDCGTTGDGLVVEGAEGTGVLVRKGTAKLSNVRVRGVTGEPGPSGAVSSGDALQVRDAQLTLGRLDASELQGSAIFASNFSTVRAASVNVDGAATAAIAAERRSHVVAEQVTAIAIRGHALAAFEQGAIEVQALTAHDVGNMAWADCLEGSVIRIGSTDAGVEWQRCVRSGR